MAAKTQITKMGFIKPYVFPILIMFLVPGFSLWFFSHVERHYDRHIRETLLSQIRTDNTLAAEQRDKALKFYEKLSVSKLLASNNPKTQRLQNSFQSVSTRFAIFRWMKRIASLCLIAG